MVGSRFAPKSAGNSKQGTGRSGEEYRVIFKGISRVWARVSPSVSPTLVPLNDWSQRGGRSQTGITAQRAAGRGDEVENSRQASRHSAEKIGRFVISEQRQKIFGFPLSAFGFSFPLSAPTFKNSSHFSRLQQLDHSHHREQKKTQRKSGKQE